MAAQSTVAVVLSTLCICFCLCCNFESAASPDIVWGSKTTFDGIERSLARFCPKKWWQTQRLIKTTKKWRQSKNEDNPKYKDGPEIKITSKMKTTFNEDDPKYKDDSRPILFYGFPRIDLVHNLLLKIWGWAWPQSRVWKNNPMIWHSSWAWQTKGL